jgi:hypothetical protein
MGLLLAAAAAAGQPANKPADPKRKPVSPVRAEFYAAPLSRLEGALARQLASKRRSPVVTWREAFVLPEDEHLFWGGRVQRVEGGSATYRAAVDWRTRWYYVTRAEPHKPVQFFGPLEEVADGDFVDVFAPPPAAAASR